jgi:hypothetical protein
MYAWDQIETLFRTVLNQTGAIIGIPVSHFAAAASVGMALVMLAISKYATHSAVRAGATIWSVVYITVSFLLVFIAWGLNATVSAGEGVKSNKALQAIVMDAQSVLPFLPLIGSAAVVVLASLGLACFGVLIGTSKNDPARFENENRARGHLIGNFAKVVVSLASVGFSIWFGVTVLGVNAALAALLGLVLDIGLINSWSKSESAAEAGDASEAKRWRGWAYVFGFAVALMAVESVGTQFKASAAAGSGAVSPQLVALLNSDVFGIMQAIGAIAIICAIGLSIVQLLLTMRPIPVAGDQPANVEPFGIRASNTIRNTRDDIGKIKAALLGQDAPSRPALPAGTVLADDGVGDGWTMRQSGNVLWFKKKFSNDTSATVRSEVGEPNATWKAWDVRDGIPDLPIAEGEAGAIGLAKADAERAALAYQPVDMSDDSAAKVAIALRKEDDELNPKRSASGASYAATAQTNGADAQGWPTRDDLPKS